MPFLLSERFNEDTPNGEIIDSDTKNDPKSQTGWISLVHEKTEPKYIPSRDEHSILKCLSTHTIHKTLDPLNLPSEACSSNKSNLSRSLKDTEDFNLSILSKAPQNPALVTRHQLVPDSKARPSVLSSPLPLSTLLESKSFNRLKPLGRPPTLPSSSTCGPLPQKVSWYSHEKNQREASSKPSSNAFALPFGTIEPLHVFDADCIAEQEIDRMSPFPTESIIANPQGSPWHDGLPEDAEFEHLVNMAMGRTKRYPCSNPLDSQLPIHNHNYLT